MLISFNQNFEMLPENLIVFVDNNYTVTEEIHFIKQKYDINLAALLKNCNFENKFGHILIIPTDQSHLRNIMIVSLGDTSELDEKKFIKLGSKIYLAIARSKLENIGISSKSLSLNNFAEHEAVCYLSFGIELRGYKFDKYFTDKKNKKYTTNVLIATHNPEKAKQFYCNLEAILAGLDFAKTITAEPANVIYPESFAKKCEGLEKIGIKVEIVDKNGMRALDMNALLGVSQGSPKEPRMVIMKWDGGKVGEPPLAFCGKGVTFDSGGLSLKSAEPMERMKYDTAGAGIVAGLMKTLALRKAKVNVVGVIGLVENMPDGHAQKPGDIVKSMSGQTIEILNTDAEGRLVLADLLWYTQSKFHPKFMIDLATLTGAIIVTFAGKYAGLFSNNDKLSHQITESGLKVDEKVWRLPLGLEYDKMLDSPIADIQNISNERGGGGSITAAQFLQRFINNKPWVHLDIAGVSWIEKDNDYHARGATGFGLRLLNQFLIDYYEK